MRKQKRPKRRVSLSTIQIPLDLTRNVIRTNREWKNLEKRKKTFATQSVVLVGVFLALCIVGLCTTNWKVQCMITLVLVMGIVVRLRASHRLEKEGLDLLSATHGHEYLFITNLGLCIDQYNRILRQTRLSAEQPHSDTPRLEIIKEELDTVINALETTTLEVFIRPHCRNCDFPRIASRALKRVEELLHRMDADFQLRKFIERGPCIPRRCNGEHCDIRGCPNHWSKKKPGLLRKFFTSQA